jgi:hypothetical protein
MTNLDGMPTAHGAFASPVHGLPPADENEPLTGGTPIDKIESWETVWIDVGGEG